MNSIRLNFICLLLIITFLERRLNQQKLFLIKNFKFYYYVGHTSLLVTLCVRWFVRPSGTSDSSQTKHPNIVIFNAHV